MRLLPLLLVLVTASSCHSASEDEEPETVALFKIEGKVIPPEQKPRDWAWDTKIMVDGGRKIGYVKEDNTFVVNGLPSGSYLVEAINPDFYYESVRVDINSKGKIRARKVNNVQPTQVNQVKASR